MSNQVDMGEFSFLSLLLDGDEHMHDEQLLATHQPQHWQAALGKFRNANSVDMIVALGQFMCFNS